MNETDWMDPDAIMLVRPPEDHLRVQIDYTNRYIELDLIEHVDPTDGASPRRWWTWESPRR